MFKKFISITVCAILALGFFAGNRQSVYAAQTDFEITAVHTRQKGDCTLLKSGNEYLLIDFGMNTDGEYMINQLKNCGIDKDTNISFLVSHLHNDHYGDYERLFSEFDIKELYLPDYCTVCPEYSGAEAVTNNIVKAWNESKETENTVVYLKLDDTFSFGSVSARVIGPVGTHSPNNGAQSVAEQYNDYLNNSSLAIKFTDTCDGFSFLCAGDIGAAEESALLNKYSEDGTLTADVFKMSHHGMNSEFTEKFFEAVKPTYSFALSTEHITYATLKYAAEYGIGYATGFEGENFKISHSASGNKLYKGTTELDGIVTLEGPRTNAFPNLHNKLKYYLKNGVPQKGLITADGSKYMFLNFSAEKGSYNNITGKYVPFVNDGTVCRAYDEDSRMYVGLTTLTTDSGEKRLYYFNPTDGTRVTGLTKIGKKTYYFVPNSVKYNYNTGYAYTKGWRNENGKYRYFNTDGTMQTGFKTIGTDTYYFNPSDGFRTTGLKKINEKTYYFSDYGKQFKGTGFKKFGEKYRYFKNGVMQTGFKTVSGSTYYLNKSNGFRVTGLKKIDGKTYFFDSYGKQFKGTGFKKFDKKYRYFKNGVMQTGFKTVGDYTYYLDKSNGFRVTGLRKINEKTYYFGSEGKQFKGTGFKKFGEKYRYFKNGVMQTGWLKVNNKKYYLGTKDGFRVTGKQKIGKKTYTFDKNGVLKS